VDLRVLLHVLRAATRRRELRGGKAREREARMAAMSRAMRFMALLSARTIIAVVGRVPFGRKTCERVSP
jgi:hypothetical protein